MAEGEFSGGGREGPSARGAAEPAAGLTLSGAGGRRLRLLFLEEPGLGQFLDHLIDRLGRACEVRHVKPKDLSEVSEAVRWADCIWLEWAGSVAAAATNRLPELAGKPVICRLHGFEVFTPRPGEINWAVVDRVVFVARHKQALFGRLFPKARVAQCVIRNGVDVGRFTIPPGKTNTKKLLVLGHLNYRKGLPMLVQFFRELLKADADYRLCVRGDWQDVRYQMAVETMVRELKLEDRIEFVQEWIEDLNAFLADKSHVLSFSLEESFHYAVGQGMAAGLKPVIHAWTESREIWPEQYIFNDLDGFLGIMLDGRYDPAAYRQVLLDRGLTADVQAAHIARLIEEVCKPYRAKAPEAPAAAPPGSPAAAPAAPAEAAASAARQPAPPPTARPAAKQPPSTPSARRPEAPSLEQLKSQYSTANPLKIVLKQGEAVRSYMNLQHHVADSGSALSPDALLYMLQVAFHGVIGEYFNTLKLPEAEMGLTLRILERLERQESLRSGLTAGRQGEASVLCKVFDFLAEHLPPADGETSVELTPAEEVLSRDGATPRVKFIYAAVRSAFEPLLEEGHVSSLMVHGSLATLDFTPFSDVDTQVFLTGEAFSSPQAVRKVAVTVHSANSLIKAFDPIQHHGYFLSLDADRRAYPQSLLPLETMRQAAGVLGSARQRFRLRPCGLENRTAMWNLCYFFRTAYLGGYRPKMPFDVKRFLSRFMMLPVLYLELFEDRYPYKRESFEMARGRFPPALWGAYDAAAAARRQWTPQNTVRFGEAFYRQVFEIAEFILERLKDLPDG